MEYSGDDIRIMSDESELQMIVKNDVFMDIIESVHSECSELCRANLQASKMGRQTKWQSSDMRGDRTCWITPDLCRENNLSGVEILVKRLIKLTSTFKQSLKLNGEFSAQFALYPGNGARYTRHFDAQPTTDMKSCRKLTLLYYINNEYKGGNLRVYCKNTAEFSESSSIDLEPQAGRLVLFRSDKLEHEVLPCYSDRMAIAVWASCDNPLYQATVPLPLPVNVSSVPVSMSSIITSSSISNCSCSASHIMGGDSADIAPLTVPEYATSQLAVQGTILVSIAAYRDSECKHTIHDLFMRAAVPARVHVAVLWQAEDSDGDCVYPINPRGPSDMSSGSYHEQVTVLRMAHTDARGPCWARHIVGSLWQGEQYVLQIDSHMRFRPGWDTYLIALLEFTRTQKMSAKPVLTTYPLGYTLPSVVPKDIRAVVLQPLKFDSDGMLRQIGRAVAVTVVAKIAVSTSSSSISSSTLASLSQEDLALANASSPSFTAVPSPMWAAGFSFSDSAVLQEVAYDPLLPCLFFGEEAVMACRLFTSGYDFFAPPEAVLYHLWTRAHRPCFHNSDQLARTAHCRQDSQQRVQRLLGMANDSTARTGGSRSTANHAAGTVEFGRYGLGNVRSLSEFEINCGVSFRTREIVPPVLPDGMEFANSQAGDEEWQSERTHLLSRVSQVSSQVQDLLNSYLLK